MLKKSSVRGILQGGGSNAESIDEKAVEFNQTHSEVNQKAVTNEINAFAYSSLDKLENDVNDYALELLDSMLNEKTDEDARQKDFTFLPKYNREIHSEPAVKRRRSREPERNFYGNWDVSPLCNSRSRTNNQVKKLKVNWNPLKMTLANLKNAQSKLRNDDLFPARDLLPKKPSHYSPICYDVSSDSDSDSDSDFEVVYVKLGNKPSLPDEMKSLGNLELSDKNSTVNDLALLIAKVSHYVDPNLMHYNTSGIQIDSHVQSESKEHQQIRQMEQCAKQSLSYETHCFVITNMFDVDAQKLPFWDLQIKSDVVSKCKAVNGEPMSIFIEDNTGNVFVECSSSEAASRSIKYLRGRRYNNRKIGVNYVFPEIFHERSLQAAMSTMQSYVY